MVFLPNQIVISPGANTTPPTVNPNIVTTIPVDSPVTIPGTNQTTITTNLNPVVSTPFQVKLFPSSAQPIVSTGQPLSVLVAPFEGPANTEIATSVGQMFSIATSSGADWNFVYEVGVPTSYSSMSVALRNNCEGHDLQIIIVMPPYMQLDLSSFGLQAGQLDTVGGTPISGSLTSPAFMLTRGTVTQFSVGFALPGAINLSGQRHGNISFPMIVQVTPLNVNGPVFVFTNLPTLTIQANPGLAPGTGPAPTRGQPGSFTNANLNPTLLNTPVHLPGGNEIFGVVAI